MSSDGATPFAIVTRKPDGRRLIFSRHATKESAEASAAPLRRMLGYAKVMRVAGRPGEVVSQPAGRATAWPAST
jgi:hypothetical protein